jgi:hypothetical protein
MKIRNQIWNKFKMLIQMTLCGLFSIMLFIQTTLTLQDVLRKKPLLVQVIYPKIKRVRDMSSILKWKVKKPVSFRKRCPVSIALPPVLFTTTKIYGMIYD